MELRGDERGQSMQVGAVVLFGFLVVALSLYQAAVVPQENERVEFQHSQSAQAGLESVRNGLVATATGGERRPVAVPLGTRYPVRAFAVNPPPASGTLRTEGTDDPGVNVTVDGVSAAGEVGDFWNGSRRAYDTGFLAYEPAYAEYDSAPTTRYEHTVLYNEFPNGHRAPLTGATLVDGRRVHLVVLDGSLRERGVGAATVDPRPLSVSTNAVTVENGSGVTVTFPTRLDGEAWADLVDGEFASVSVAAGDPYNTAAVSLTDTTYELRVSRVGLGRVGDADERAAYLTAVDPLAPGLVTNRSDTVVVEVRDRYNNPVSGVAVRANDSSGLAVESPLGNRSDADGRVSYAVTPTEAGSATLSFAIGNDSGAWENVSYHRRVSDARGGSGDGGGSPPTASFTVTPDAPKAGETASFDASGSSDDGSVAAYDWEFGDGTAGTGEQASRAFASSGTYPVTLTVTDDDGNADSHTRDVTVTSDSPSSVTYPSDYRDQNGGPAIPPENPNGVVSAFDQMQPNNEQYASLDAGATRSEPAYAMRVGIATTGTPTDATSYDLEVRYATSLPAPVEARVVDDSGSGLQSVQLPATDGNPTTVNVSLNRAARDSIREDGTLYVEYRFEGSQKMTLSVYRQYVEAYD